jgi:hypothetical protein
MCIVNVSRTCDHANHPRVCQPLFFLWVFMHTGCVITLHYQRLLYTRRGGVNPRTEIELWIKQIVYNSWARNSRQSHRSISRGIPMRNKLTHERMLSDKRTCSRDGLYSVYELQHWKNDMLCNYAVWAITEKRTVREVLDIILLLYSTPIISVHPTSLWFSLVTFYCVGQHSGNTIFRSPGLGTLSGSSCPRAFVVSSLIPEERGDSASKYATAALLPIASHS